ncbi:SRPBCC family protein [Dietzia sp. 179-F 9C3 NHS]|uniref:SRPBCC family protein n=1 Tax=Dietzia sp. 179-F 9C3 NHS TaxID=3374295 RepID=UPI003879135E
MTTDPTPAQLESSIEIDAPPARVWEIVSEVRNAPQWSSQAVKVLALGGRTKPGTLALNLNKQGTLVWPTTSKVVEVEPGRRIANKVLENGTVWAFELEPTGTGGTRLTERRETPNGTSALSDFLVDKFFGGQERFTDVLDQGVSTSLQRIKALAERGV